MTKFLLIAIIFLVGCDQQKTDSSTTVDKKDTTDDTYIATTPLTQCYGWVAGKDTAHLKLTFGNNNSVVGDLVFDWNEKDGNKGKLKGEQQDSMIIALYSFQSEGMLSVREVVFRIKGDQLIEGYGDIIFEGDTQKFKNRKDLKFHTDRPFLKKDCSD